MEKMSNKSKKIRRGDNVIAIAGNSRGQSGVVQSVQGDRAVVKGLNIRKKHVKKSQQVPNGAIVETEGSIHTSNLKIKVEADGVAVKLKTRVSQQGDRQFFYEKDGQEVVYRSVKKPK